ncbi:3-hydroxyacyl-CoA dehydrogenase [Verticiella sediminum]|uniref:L-gulonate 3-dehydrogenase n=1 Tax=Verticiella sediminum TaxID=1247510 RepID=A0A556AJ54_9BURK|nr:3-hydroxyacyl-CoA dehydrogenase [Verticiella sediminum]TSH92899.1 3-hydroxyacyl-CoA dehydrogenase [Verticiella sediminum]
MNVSIVGAGSIGVAFAVVFSRSGCRVALCDPDAGRREAAGDELWQCLEGLQAFQLLDEEPAAVAARVGITGSLEGAVRDAELVQECAPERLDLKQELFQRLAQAAPAGAILASSSSALPVSQYAPQGDARRRCLVAHPGNPPYLIPVIELVPAPFTSPDVLQRAAVLYRACGLAPVHVRKEVEGFVFNRLQGAVLREAYCLVRDQVADVEDIDTVMRSGLGLRWSFMGPFETVDLNTRGGIVSHAAKMGPAYARMGAERGQNDPWTPELVAAVEAQRRAQLPLEQWGERVRWRDEMLMGLRRLRKAEPDATA